MRTLNVVTVANSQKLLDSYFGKEASYWETIYSGSGVLDLIHQQRLQVVLGLAEKYLQPSAGLVLDAGCGAGLAAVALARRNHTVHAVDAVLEMVELTRKTAAAAGVRSRVRCTRADIQQLAFADAVFDLVIAAGVLPWLPSADKAVAEMSRVLKPGGRLIFSTDNRWGLCWFVDPLTNPLLKPAKELIRRAARHADRNPRVSLMSIRECQALLNSNGLRKLEETTLGFGPLSLFRRELLPRTAGLRLHRMLQTFADRGIPMLRLAGVQYIVAAEKTARI